MQLHITKSGFRVPQFLLCALTRGQYTNGEHNTSTTKKILSITQKKKSLKNI